MSNSEAPTPAAPQPTTPLTDAQLTMPLPDAQQPAVQQPAVEQFAQASQPYPNAAYPAAQQPAYVAAQQPRPTTLGGATTLAATNTYALIAIILAFLSPLGAIIFGHMALSQIKRNGDAGRGIALTGTIIGYAYFILIGLFFAIYIGFIIVMIGSMGAMFSEFGDYGTDSFVDPGYDYDYDY